MKTLDLDYDDMLWVLVPLEFPFGPFADQEAWADAVAEAFSEGTTEPALIQDSLQRCGRAILVEPQQGLHRALWYMSDPFRVPLIARVYVAPDGDDGQSLVELAGAYDSSSVRPPVVDELESEVFGTVARVVSFSKDEQNDRLVMRVTFAGRHDGAMVIIDAITWELEYGTLAIDDMAALMDSCVFGDDGSGD